MTEPGYRQRYHGEILALASGIVEAEGLEALQARRIARDAGCAVGTIYNIFGDIDGLIVAVNSRTLAELGVSLRASLEVMAGGSVHGRLLALALGYMRFAMANHRSWDAVFRHKPAARVEPPESYIEDQMRLLALIESVIADVIEDPARRASAARALFGAVHGIVALALDNRLGGLLRKELEAQIRFIVDVTARGIAGSG